MLRPAHNAVSRFAPRRSAPMHNNGAVMADALLKDTVYYNRPLTGCVISSNVAHFQCSTDHIVHATDV